MIIGLILLLALSPARAEDAAKATATAGQPKLFGGGGLVDKSMNPAVSVNGLFLGAWGNNVPNADRGLLLQEVEAQFSAAVDPYFYANVILAAEPGTGVGVEEAYITTLSIPHLTFKAGKFLVNFGKNNLLHTHAQPLIDRPLVNKMFFADAFNSVGLETSFLVPTPWYMDLTVGIVRAQGSNAFTTTEPQQVGGTVRLDNLFDLTDTTTLGVGGSFATGRNAAGTMDKLFGADVTLKYVTGKGKGDFGISWANEFINTTGQWGVYSTPLVRLNQNWWTGVRFDYFKNPTDAKTSAENLVIAYVPSEFSAIRVQGGIQQNPGGAPSTWQTFVQYNMTIGSHPAHAY